MKTFVPEGYLCAAEVAIKSGLKSGDVFYNGECNTVQRIVDEPGKHLTRGSYGEIYYSLTACNWDSEKNDYIPMTLEDYVECLSNEICWCLWDSVWGWL